MMFDPDPLLATKVTYQAKAGNARPSVVRRPDWNPGAATAVSPVCKEVPRRRLRDQRHAAAPPRRARSGPRRCELEEAAVPAPHPGPARPGVETGSRCL
ncbi:unnamed protein product [Rangifer tarandus platyrhynchus]|uniref:Uncharacterized protein n=3 Tax=Rangifer tarandus platyrhynchus TaxID=3082113 RepID=A0ACB0FFT8_RANTA|nr:unnamed protein product [Rangifer tarandus platyrhynchus]CAI9711363.1 unnamed protein product [Rangifer tarandus platyrhynchus]